MSKNPFDRVKIKGHDVDFVAKSPKLKEFKDDMLKLMDPSESPGSFIHAVVGDFGSGKSHINHHLLSLGIKNDEVLVSYVSCKNLVGDLDDTKDLYERFLTDLVKGLEVDSQDVIAEVIKDSRDKALQSDRIDLHKKLIAKEKDSKSKKHLEDLLEEMYSRAKMKKYAFIQFLDSLRSSEQYKKEIKRVVFIVDEFEVFARTHYIEALQNVAAMRDDLQRYDDIIWIFSCAFRSWNYIKENDASTDTFGGDLTTAHMIPNYDKDDRKEMIWSRILSLLPAYADGLSGALSDEEMSEYCRPFYNWRDGGEWIRGGDIAEMIARPQLSPRRLIANCGDFYETFLKELSGGKTSEGEAFKKAKKNLLKDHFFDLVAKENFERLQGDIFMMIEEEFGGSVCDQEKFDMMFRQLFELYLTYKTKVPGGGFQEGFISVDEHRNTIWRFLAAVLNLPPDRPPGSPASSKAGKLLYQVENELKLRCLQETMVAKFERTFLMFKVSDFLPIGNLPYLSEAFHRRLDEAAGMDNIMPEEELKEIFDVLMKDEGRTFTPSQFKNVKADLLDTGKIEKIPGEQVKYRINDRSMKSADSEFTELMKKFLKKAKSDDEKLMDNLMDVDYNFFYPPLEGKGNIKTIKKNMPSEVADIVRVGNIKVVVLKKIDDDFKESIEIAGHRLVLTTLENGAFEKAGIPLVAKEKHIFITNTVKGCLSSPIILVPDGITHTEFIDCITWKEFLTHYKDIQKMAKEAGVQDKVSRANEQIQRYLQEVIERIPRQKPWDTTEFYGLKLTDIGKTKIEDSIELLARVIKDGKADVKSVKTDAAKVLPSIYPWITLSNGFLRKEAKKCNSEAHGIKLDDAAHGLFKLIPKDGISLNKLVDKYLQSIEKKNDISNNTKGNYRTRIQTPIAVLIYSLAKAIPEAIKIEDDLVILSEGTTLERYDTELLGWFSKFMDDKATMKMYKGTQNPETDRIDDLEDDIQMFIRIHNGLEGASEKEIYLTKMFVSKIKKKEIEVGKFLDYAQLIAKAILKCCHDDWIVARDWKWKDQVAIEKSIDNINKQINDESLDKNLRDGLKKALKLSEIESLAPINDAILKKVKTLEKSLKNVETDFDQAEMMGYLSKKPELLGEVDDLKKNIIAFDIKVKEHKISIETYLKKLINDNANAILELRNFLANERAVMERADDNSREKLKKLEEELRRLEETFRKGLVEDIKDISKKNKLMDEVNSLLQDIALGSIDNTIAGIKGMVDNFAKLSLTHTEDKTQTKKRFEDIIESIDKEVEQHREKAKKSIADRRGLTKAVINDIIAAKTGYESNAVETTRRCISKRYQDFLASVIEALRDKRLMQYLLNIQEEEGEAELILRLKFLNDMERNGLIKY